MWNICDCMSEFWSWPMNHYDVQIQCWMCAAVWWYRLDLLHWYILRSISEDFVLVNFLRSELIILSFRISSLRRIALAEKYFHDIPEHQQRLLPSFNETLLKLQQAVDHNYLVVKQIIRSVDKMFENKNFAIDSVCAYTILSRSQFSFRWEGNSYVVSSPLYRHAKITF